MAQTPELTTDDTSTEPPAAFVERCSEWLRSNDFSDSTIELYRHAANLWMRFARPWDEGWHVRSIDWRKSLASKALKTQSVYCAGAKSFTKHLLLAGVIEGQNPFDSVRVRGMNAESSHRRALTDVEVQKLFASCDLKTEDGLRDHALLITLLHTALRIRAVAGFTTEDIEKQGDAWIVRYTGKGQRSKSRVKRLAENVIMAIKVYLKKTGRTLSDKGPVFLRKGEAITTSGIRRAIKWHLKECGIMDSAVTVHSFRHTAATKALDSGADIKAVQQLLDHANIATTDRYIHSVRDGEQAAEISINYDTETPNAKRRSKKGRA